jgi:hypothetical protein
MLKLKRGQNGGMDLAKDANCFSGNNNIPAAPVDECRVF